MTTSSLGDDGAATKTAAQSLFTFLDECGAETAVDENRPPRAPMAGIGPAATPKLQAENAITKVKCQLVDMKLAEKRDRNRIAALEAALAQAKQQMETEVRNAQAELQAKLHDQKVEYDRALQRQLQFVDQLLADKKSLTEKVETQVALAEHVRTAAANEAREREQAWNLRMDKMRRDWEENERARRTLWANEKTEIIRARLLNEFQKAGDSRSQRIARELNDRHQKEMDALRAACERDTLTRVAAANTALSAQFEERLRQLEAERLGELERSLAQHQAAVLALRQELTAQFEAERRSWEHDRDRDLAELRKQLDTERLNMAALRDAHRDDLDKVRRKAQLEVAKHKDRLQAQFDAHRADWLRESEAQLRERERTLRERAVAERDAQIHAIVDRLSQEAADKEARWDKQRRSDVDAVTKQLERAETSWTDRYDQLMGKYREACERAEEARKTASEAKEDRAVLLRRKDEAEAALRKLEAARAVELEQNAEQLDRDRVEWRQALDQARASEKAAREGAALAQDQLERSIREVEARRNDEMVQVEGKVRAAMSRKDATIATLRNQLESKEMQLEHMRRALDKHKRDLLGL